MTIFSNLFRRIINWRRPKPPPTIEDRLLWLLRPYLSTLEDILLWKNIPLSIGFLLFVNAFVWWLRVSSVPILGLVGAALTMCAVLDAIASVGRGRLRNRRTSGTPVSPTAPHLHAAASCTTRQLNSVFLYLRDLRREDHSKFCFLMCVGISTLWLVVWSCGGLVVHSALCAVLAAPLAPFLRDSIAATLSNHHESDGEMEGFLPEMSPLALRELQQAGEPVSSGPLSISADLSLPPDSVGGALRYAAGEASSSEDEMDREPEDYPPSTDSTDSDTEFLLHDRTKKVLVVGAPSAPPQRDSDSDFELVDKDDL